MADERRGCGCCGLFFGLVALIIALALVGAGIFLFNLTTTLNRLSSITPAELPAVAGGAQAYDGARQKLDHFFSDPNERNLTLSEAEANALVDNSPELGFLNRGVVIVLREDSAEIHCDIPVSLPYFGNKYLNYTFFVRPSLRGEDVELQVSRIERDGKPLTQNEIADFQRETLPNVNRAFSVANKYEADRSVRDIRIENGVLVLSR